MSPLTDHADELRVLIVEDEALIAEELGERLRRMGMTVAATVDSSDAAVAAAIEHRPDLVLMDIRVKGARDGIEAAAEIRRASDVPIVYITAHSDRATLTRAKATGAVGYVLKPFQEREFNVAIEMALHRHRLERELRRSERRYVATLSSIGDGVIAVDGQSRVTFLNPVAEALTGWSFQDARGLPADEVFRVSADARATAVVRPLRRALDEKRTIRFGDELFLLSRSDEVIPIDDSAAPILDDRDGVVGAVVAFRDIRDRRLAEDALRVAQDELSQAQRMESVGRLAAGIAHDFNNLLTVINGCCELALEDPGLRPQTRELLRDVITAGGRAAALTRQFLAFGRKQAREARVVDLAKLLVDLEGMLRRLLGVQVEFETRTGRARVPVMADPAQLEQIIVNLAVNARDAMPDGGKLTIEVTPMERTQDSFPGSSVPAGQYALLTVTDTGVGIPEAVRGQIFEPYFTTKELGKGSGLGLATVYGIVKQSEGFIEVDSGPAEGTTFRIFLPLARKAAGDASAIEEG